MVDDIILRWTGSKYIGIDPSDGSQVPLPFGDAEFDALEAGELTNTNQNGGTIASLKHSFNDNNTTIDAVNKATGIQDTATPIFDMDKFGVSNVAMVLVDFVENSSHRGGDLLLYTGFGGANVIGSQERQSPQARSYSVNERKLRLSYGSGSSDVRTICRGVFTI